MKKSYIPLFFVFFLLILLGISFLNFSLSFYDLPPTDAVLQNKDAVVVLTGGKGRLTKALQIFTKTSAKWFLISGVGEATSIESIFSKQELQGIDYNRVILERESKSTLENAEFALDLLLERRVRSVILVTSNYHMTRALYIFQNIFPDNIEIIPYMVESDITLRFSLTEYFKYWWYRLIL